MSKERLRLFFDKACAISLYVLIFFIPISSAAVESLFGFAWLFFLGRLFTSEGLFSQLLKNEKIAFLLFVSLAFSLINSGSLLPISLHALFLKWGKYIILYLMITQTLTSGRRIKYAIAIISFGTVLIILDCYSQLFFNFEFLRQRNMALHSNNISALTGPFTHNNNLAAYLSCTLIIILYWLFSKNTKMIKSMAVTIFFLGTFILSRAYSRGGWLIFIIAIILLAILLKKFRFLGFSLLVVIILGLKFSFFKFLRFKDSGRFELWDISLRMIKEHPLLGNGIGTFMALFRNFSPSRSISYAHNCFLQLWAEAGLIALVIFIFFIVKTLNGDLSFYNKTKDSIFAILICAITAYLCHSFFDTHLFSLQVATLFWVLMGLARQPIPPAASFGSSVVEISQ
ncbi:MAG: O-antigen ligase family protein [Deltaproteobacteria bacterium]